MWCLHSEASEVKEWAGEVFWRKGHERVSGQMREGAGHAGGSRMGHVGLHEKGHLGRGRTLANFCFNRLTGLMWPWTLGRKRCWESGQGASVQAVGDGGWDPGSQRRDGKKWPWFCNNSSAWVIKWFCKVCRSFNLVFEKSEHRHHHWFGKRKGLCVTLLCYGCLCINPLNFKTSSFRYCGCKLITYQSADASWNCMFYLCFFTKLNFSLSSLRNTVAKGSVCITVSYCLRQVKDPETGNSHQLQRRR